MADYVGYSANAPTSAFARYDVTPFRQELDELVRSIVIDKNRARDLPAFEAACVALGYIYEKDECALYREEVVRVEPKTEKVRVV